MSTSAEVRKENNEKPDDPDSFIEKCLEFYKENKCSLTIGLMVTTFGYTLIFFNKYFINSG